MFTNVGNDASLEDQQPGEINMLNLMGHNSRKSNTTFNVNIKNVIKETFVQQHGPSNTTRPI